METGLHWVIGGAATGNKVISLAKLSKDLKRGPGDSQRYRKVVMN